MLAKYVLCILTIEWAVLGMRLLKGKGHSYERIWNDDRIREKEQFVRFQGMNLLYLALVAFLTLLTTFAGSDRLTIRFFELTALALFGRFSGKIWVAAGLLSMSCGLFSDSMAALFLFIVAITAAAFGSILYSYLYYRKKLRTGKGLAVHCNHKVVAVYVFIMLACVLFTVWTLYTGKIEICYGENEFTVQAEGWQDYTVKYDAIDSISCDANMCPDTN